MSFSCFFVFFRQICDKHTHTDSCLYPPKQYHLEISTFSAYIDKLLSVIMWKETNETTNKRNVITVTVKASRSNLLFLNSHTASHSTFGTVFVAAFGISYSMKFRISWVNQSGLISEPLQQCVPYFVTVLILSLYASLFSYDGHRSSFRCLSVPVYCFYCFALCLYLAYKINQSIKLSVFWEKINSNCCGFSCFGDVTYLLTYLLADFRWHLNIVVDRIMLYSIYRLFSTVTSIVSTTWCLNKPIAADRQWSSCCKSRARRCFYKRAAKSESLTDSLLSTRCHHHVSSRHWSAVLDRHNPSLYSISVCHISQPTSQFSAWLNEHFSKKN